MKIDPRTQALLTRALLGLVLVELPVISLELQRPTFDYRLLAIGLIGAAAGFLDKLMSPQLADTYLPVRDGTQTPAPVAEVPPPVV